MPPYPRISTVRTTLAIWGTLLLILTGLAHAQPAQPDPYARWRARIDEAKRLNIPPPAKGIRDTAWTALVPPDWDVARVMQQVRAAWPGVDPHHAEKNDPRVLAMERAMQTAFDEAPSVTVPDDMPIRLTGFAVLIDPGDGLAGKVLFVPYHGVGMDRLAPAANQMVLAVFKKGLPRNLEQQPLWITGRLYPLASQTVHGRAAYIMPDAHWQKFPATQYPMPRYRPPR